MLETWGAKKRLLLRQASEHIKLAFRRRVLPVSQGLRSPPRSSGPFKYTANGFMHSASPKLAVVIDDPHSVYALFASPPGRLVQHAEYFAQKAHLVYDRPQLLRPSSALATRRHCSQPGVETATPVGWPQWAYQRPRLAAAAARTVPVAAVVVAVGW